MQKHSINQAGRVCYANGTFDRWYILIGMRTFTLFTLLLTSANVISAEADTVMHDFAWQNRVLLIFSPVHDSVMFNKQNILLSRAADGLSERDVVVIHISDSVSIDQKPHTAAAGGFLQRYHVNQDEFRIILVGKDGTVKLDQATPVTMNTLFTLIDAMPMRQKEMRLHGY